MERINNFFDPTICSWVQIISISLCLFSSLGSEQMNLSDVRMRTPPPLPVVLSLLIMLYPGGQTSESDISLVNHVSVPMMTSGWEESTNLPSQPSYSLLI